MLSMEAVLGVVNAKTRGGVSRTGEIEVQCPMGVCGHKKKPVYFSVNLERGQYNCFHCCTCCSTISYIFAHICTNIYSTYY